MKGIKKDYSANRVNVFPSSLGGWGHSFLHLFILHSSFFILFLTFTSCSVDKFIEENELYLKKVKVISTNKEATKEYYLSNYVLQTPNSNWFGFKVPMNIYCLSNPNSNSWVSKTLRKIGQKPEIYSVQKAFNTISDMDQVLANAGYTHNYIELKQDVKGKKLKLTYIVHPGKRYQVRSLKRNVEDSHLQQILCEQDTANSLLRVGMPLDINLLNQERSRITSMLRNVGYYKFNKDDISFEADTANGNYDVDLRMNVSLHLENGRSNPEEHTQYRIGDVTFHTDIMGDSTHQNTVEHKGSTIYYSDKLHFRPNLLTSNTLLKPGELYNEDHQRRTYNNFMRLNAISYSNIRLQQRNQSDTLDCHITVNHARPHSISFDLEGTNSAGDLGAATSFSYQHKNIFKGSENFLIKLRGAYEAITGLDGYEGHSYTELGGEMRLSFPGFLLPFVKKEFGSRHHATSEISLQFNRQNRPEFNRRVFSAAWRYRWQSHQSRVQHRFDLLEVNYINMPWISRTFREQYLDSLGRQNAILRYNYENLLITKLGYYYSYNSLGVANANTYGKNAYTIRFNIETSGNFLWGLSHAAHFSKNSNSQYEFLGIAYAQYVRGDFDFAKSFRIDKNNSVAIHAAFGLAYPYGNSNQLPFEKRYFSGGPNSVRGWTVRSLGPGAYKGADRQINFLNQSGDIKLDFSVEYRAFLFWKLNGALFVDGGNIWTIRQYQDQPEGEFRFDKFYKQIAFSYGIGLRLNLDFFIVRFDAGMKAINPAYETTREHYPIAHPNLDRDFAFHFAIGLPF